MSPSPIQRRCAALLAHALLARGIGPGSILKYLWRAYGATLTNADLCAIVGEAVLSTSASKEA